MQGINVQACANRQKPKDPDAVNSTQNVEFKHKIMSLTSGEACLLKKLGMVPSKGKERKEEGAKGRSIEGTTYRGTKERDGRAEG
ncbi:hypothetical protein EYF80_008113 [Liparis tanakae]|uniref:Uncharacterized protein n=1 Tax=Liparis tanakae TaxID=230148 RepID=A0A4Z2IVA2_9TELE|nr:hypothetical protein EYF80_008113 [Liparis tanakae]